MFQAAAQMIVKTTLEVALHCGQIDTVGARVRVVYALRFHEVPVGVVDLDTALVLKMKTDQACQMGREAVVALVDKLITVIHQLGVIRSGAVEFGLAGSGEIGRAS